MAWLNEYEVTEALAELGDDRTLGPYVRTLSNLVEWTNGHSDGWPYWAKPSKASAKLQDLIGSAMRDIRTGRAWEDGRWPTRAELRRSLAPVRAFLTRQGIAHGEVIAPGA